MAWVNPWLPMVTGMGPHALHGAGGGAAQSFRRHSQGLERQFGQTSDGRSLSPASLEARFWHAVTARESRDEN